MEQINTGDQAEAGPYSCTSCGYQVTLGDEDVVPPCFYCGKGVFTRASIFIDPAIQHTSLFENLEDVEEAMPKVPANTKPGKYLAVQRKGKSKLMPLGAKLTRIGRSTNADIRLDDPSVSRRHAIIASHDDRDLIMDDRSMNGVYVNGERVERCRLSDGDEVVMGRFRFRYIDTLKERAKDLLSGQQAIA